MSEEMNDISSSLGFKIFISIWIITWFLCIWIKDYRCELFWSGVWSLAIALMVLIGYSKGREES